MPYLMVQTNVSVDEARKTGLLKSLSAKTAAALGKPENRPLAVRVNGSVVNSSLAFPQTASWTDWQTVNLNANFNQGILTTVILGDAS